MRPAGMPCRSDLYDTVQEPACIVFSVRVAAALLALLTAASLTEFGD